MIDAVLRPIDANEYRLGGPVPPECYRAQVLAGAQRMTPGRASTRFEPRPSSSGAEDRVLPPANSTLLQAKIRGARLQSVPRAGHLLPLEQPALLGELLLAFWAASEPGPR